MPTPASRTSPVTFPAPQSEFALSLSPVIARVKVVEIIAHRGASHAAPENTLASARLAWEEGADALELDIQLTADAQLAVVHDKDLRRLAGSSLQVGQSTLAELQQLDVGRWKNPRFAGEKIPALDAMLATLPTGKRVFIEVKNGPEAIPPLVSCLRETRVTAKQIVIISFDFAAAAAAKKALPPVEAAWILDYHGEAGRTSLDELVQRCRAASLDALDLSATWPIDPLMVSRVQQAGLKLYVWTVDAASTARRLAASGVDGIATNRPAALRRELGL